jgi:hypothetical protein
VTAFDPSVVPIGWSSGNGADANVMLFGCCAGLQIISGSVSVDQHERPVQGVQVLGTIAQGPGAGVPSRRFGMPAARRGAAQQLGRRSVPSDFEIQATLSAVRPQLMVHPHRVKLARDEVSRQVPGSQISGVRTTQGASHLSRDPVDGGHTDECQIHPGARSPTQGCVAAQRKIPGNISHQR